MLSSISEDIGTNQMTRKKYVNAHLGMMMNFRIEKSNRPFHVKVNVYITFVCHCNDSLASDFLWNFSSVGVADKVETPPNYLGRGGSHNSSSKYT